MKSAQSPPQAAHPTQSPSQSKEAAVSDTDGCDPRGETHVPHVTASLAVPGSAKYPRSQPQRGDSWDPGGSVFPPTSPGRGPHPHPPASSMGRGLLGRQPWDVPLAQQLCVSPHASPYPYPSPYSQPLPRPARAHAGLIGASASCAWQLRPLQRQLPTSLPGRRHPCRLAGLGAGPGKPLRSPR